MKTTLSLLVACLALLCGLAGCNRGGPAARKKLYGVQALKGHPVHQMTQTAFQEGRRAHGYEPVVLGTDGPDIAGTVALAEQALATGDVAGMAVWTGNPAY